MLSSKTHSEKNFVELLFWELGGHVKASEYQKLAARTFDMELILKKSAKNLATHSGI
jgi:hypothetical protein